MIKTINIESHYGSIQVQDDLNSIRCANCGSKLVAIINEQDTFSKGHSHLEHEICCENCNWSLIDLTNVVIG